MCEFNCKLTRELYRSYVTSNLMKGCSRRHLLQSYIARLVYMHGYLMPLNRSLAWEELRAFYLVEMLCLVNLGNTMCGKSISTKEFT